MSWLDTLLDRGNEAKRVEPYRAHPAPGRGRPIARPVIRPTATDVAVALPAVPKADLKTVWVTTRQPLDDDDPGAAEPGFYSIADGVVTMHEESGKPTGKSQRLTDGDDPHVIARRLTREARLKEAGTSDFNRPLSYPKSGVA